MKAIAVVTIIAAQAAAFSMARPPASVVIGFHPSVSSLSYPNSSHHHSSIGSNNQHQSTTSLNLSSASIGGLLIRGGAAVTDAPVRNFYGEALGYFGGIRIPATFLGKREHVLI